MIVEVLKVFLEAVRLIGEIVKVTIEAMRLIAASRISIKGKVKAVRVIGRPWE